MRSCLVSEVRHNLISPLIKPVANFLPSGLNFTETILDIVSLNTEPVKSALAKLVFFKSTSLR